MSYPDEKRILKVMEKINSGKIKPTYLLDKDASPLDKMKFNICQRIISFKREYNYTNLDLSKILDIGPAVVSRILHCQLSKFKVDSLLSYYFALIISSQDKKLIKSFHDELSHFMKDLAA